MISTTLQGRWAIAMVIHKGVEDFLARLTSAGVNENFPQYDIISEIKYPGKI